MASTASSSSRTAGALADRTRVPASIIRSAPPKWASARVPGRRAHQLGIDRLDAPARRSRRSASRDRRHRVAGHGRCRGACAAPRSRRSPTKVTVLDMQPIDPAVGGGRLRLLGLYHASATHLPTTYVGTYDWPGPGYRDHQLTAHAPGDRCAAERSALRGGGRMAPAGRRQDGDRRVVSDCWRITRPSS